MSAWQLKLTMGHPNGTEIPHCNGIHSYVQSCRPNVSTAAKAGVTLQPVPSEPAGAKPAGWQVEYAIPSSVPLTKPQPVPKAALKAAYFYT